MKTKSLLILALLGALNALAATAPQAQANSAANDFSFAIIADPQISGADNKGEVAVKSVADLKQSIAEINALKPDFTVFLGDLVNVFDKPSVDNFRDCLKSLNTKIYLVHGNHDTNPPFTGFLKLQQEYNPGITTANYSFERNGWLFIALPCWFDLDDDVLQWLDNELKTHKDMPVVVLEHFPFLPTGLSQLEFYTFSIPMRNRLLDIMTRYGNVKYYFNGHVHNGIKTSVKTAWQYKGITFITCPTGTVARPFGEEYSGFRQDYPSGYYLVCKVSKDNATMTMQGHQAKNDYVHTYPATFPAFDPNLDPRWFKSIDQLPVQPRWTNGDFSNGLEGWTKKFRYMKDKNPAFGCEVVQVDGKPMLRAKVKAPASTFWADDEHIEAYRVVAVTPGETVRLCADYKVEKLKNGGGFVRVTAFAKNHKPYLFFFKWGDGKEAESSYVPRCFGHELQGRAANWKYLADLGAKKQAFFIEVDPTSGTINADLGKIYDATVGAPGAFAALGVDKIWVSVGTWDTKKPGSESQALFGNIYAGPESTAPKTLGKAGDYTATTTTDFGSALDVRAKTGAVRKREAVPAY